MSSNRLGRDTLFMAVASLVAERGTCTRAKVGALIVLDRRIISTGYVGSAPGEPHCIDVGCKIDEATGGCIRTIHAEANAIAYAARSGLSVQGADLYSTYSPCRTCGHLALSAGISRVVYLSQYRDNNITLNLEQIAFQPQPWGHPYIGYQESECLLCNKRINDHSG